MNYEIDDQEVKQLRSDANVLLFRAEEVAKIASPLEEVAATEFLAEAKRRYKVVDEKRKEYVKPLKDVIDKINSDFKTVLDPLQQVENIVKKGMVSYRNSEEMKRKVAEREEAERKAQEAIKTIKNEGLTDASLQNAQEATQAVKEAAKEAPKTVATSAGNASYRKETKFEIVDGSKLPPRVIEAVLKLAFEKGLYEQVVRGMIKAGHQEIEGVRIWEESVPVIRT